MAPFATTRLLNLPDDVIIKILQCLSVPDLVLGVRPTSRYFHRLSYAPNLWKHITLEARRPEDRRAYYFSEMYCLGLLSQKCIEEVTNNNQSAPISGGLDHVPSGVKQKEVNGGPSHSSDPGCYTMNEVLDLKDVPTFIEERGDLPYTCSITGDVVYSSVKKVALYVDKLPDLRFLSNSEHRNLGSLRIEKNAASSDKQIEMVQIAECFQRLICFQGLKTLELIIGNFNRKLLSAAKIAVSDYIVSGPMLKRLQLDIPLTSALVRSIFDHCSELEDLQLSNAKLTEKAFTLVLSKTYSSLSALRLKGSVLKDERVLYAILKGFTNLRELELSLDYDSYEQISESGKQLLLGGLSQLTVLKLSAVKPLTADSDDGSGVVDNSERSDSGEAGPEGGGKLPLHWSTLLHREGEGQVQELQLEGFQQMNSAILQDMFYHQTALRSVGVTSQLGLVKLEDSCLKILARRCQQLRSVDVYNCRQVSVAGVCELMKKLPYLESLKCSVSYSQDGFHHCLSTIGGKGLKRSRLQVLSLSPWFDATPLELTALTLWCPGLTDLNITDCLSLTDACLEVILGNCPYLQKLYVDMGNENKRHGWLSDNGLGCIEKLGTCLRTVHLLVNLDNCSYDILARTVLRSDSLEDFTISEDRSKNSVIRIRLAMDTQVGICWWLKKRLSVRFRHAEGGYFVVYFHVERLRKGVSYYEWKR